LDSRGPGESTSQAKRYNIDKKRQPTKLKVGDLVLWKHDRIIDPNSRKILKKFKTKKYGPFKIIGTGGPNAFKIKLVETGMFYETPKEQDDSISNVGSKNLPVVHVLR